MSASLRFLVAESEPPEDRERRRKSVGRSSGETYIETLQSLFDGCACDRITPADNDGAEPNSERLTEYDAVFLTGSPLHLYEDTPEVRREVAFMRAVFASGTPSFGSCAGLQVATVAAGGTVRPMGHEREAGFARRITPTQAGRDHPLLAGRPAAWDAPAVHGDEVDLLPPGAVLLASNKVTRVQAVEYRFGRGVFWGVQYHPELTIHEVAAALRRQAADLVEHGLAADEASVDDHAALIERLNEDGREGRDAAWRLGLDAELIDVARRTTELRNFVAHLVEPVRRARRA